MYAVESDDVIQVAREEEAANGFVDDPASSRDVIPRTPRVSNVRAFADVLTYAASDD